MSDFSRSPSVPMERTKYSFAILKLFVNEENKELVELYKQHVEQHNHAVQNDMFPNSGFDVFVPESTVFDTLVKTKMINMQIKTEMLYYNTDTNTTETCAYMVFPRSSISKTPLMLANHTGIIDSGYRGWLIGAFRCLEFLDNTTGYIVDKNTRLLQICHPTLCPIYVKLVPEEQLSVTSRGSGGFGSTGIIGV
jgi:dUTP pyrophosphatase